MSLEIDQSFDLASSMNDSPVASHSRNLPAPNLAPKREHKISRIADQPTRHESMMTLQGDF